MATPNMGLTLPTIDGSTGTWDTILNAALELVDAHDHTAGSGVRIAPGAININADLTFGGNAATNLKAAAFTAQASYTTARSLWVRTSDNELIFRTSGGMDIQITSGTSLNLSLVGGITGDYAAASAALYYDDAAEAYRFLEAAPSPNDWSRVACGDLDLYEHASGIANRVRLSSPAALAASYALTFPAAAPGSTLAVQCSSAGALSFSNTFAGAMVAQAGLQITGGAADFDAASSISLPSRTLLLPPVNAFVLTDANVTSVGEVSITAGTSVVRVAIPLHAGDRITEISVRWNSSAGTTCSFLLTRARDGALTDLCVKDVTVSSGAQTTSIGTSPTSGSLPQTLVAADFYYITISAMEGGDSIYAIDVTYDRP